MNIKAKLIGKVVTLGLDGRVYYLSEEDCRRMRAEINRCLQRFAEKRR